jgi:hypothetical protein
LVNNGGETQQVLGFVLKTNGTLTGMAIVTASPPPLQ